MNKPHTWGSIFNNALARGYCHGGAAYLADRWELRKVKEMTMQTRFHDGSWWAYDPQFDSDTGPYSTQEQAQEWIDAIVPVTPDGRHEQ